MKSKSRTILIQKLTLHAALTPLALIWIFPLWMMFVFSTMPDYGIFSPDIVLWPSTNFVENFNNLQADTNFLRAMFISITVAVCAGGFSAKYRPSSLAPEPASMLPR